MQKRVQNTHCTLKKEYIMHFISYLLKEFLKFLYVVHFILYLFDANSDYKKEILNISAWNVVIPNPAIACCRKMQEYSLCTHNYTKTYNAAIVINTNKILRLFIS